MRRQWGHPASHTTSRMVDDKETTSSEFLGTLASVADAERAGLALSLEGNRGKDMVLLLTDSMTAYRSALHLARGNPPRSAFEKRIKLALLARENLDTAISWVRSHIGISGNEKLSRPSRRLAKPSGPHLRRTHLRYLRRTSSPRQGTQETTPSATRPRDGPSHHLESEGPISLHLDVNQQRPTTGMATPDP